MDPALTSMRLTHLKIGTILCVLLLLTGCGINASQSAYLPGLLVLLLGLFSCRPQLLKNDLPLFSLRYLFGQKAGGSFSGSSCNRIKDFSAGISAATNDLDQTGDGFIIEATGANNFLGDVAPAGDFNGDGMADFVISERGFDNLNGGDAGRAYVLFGRSDWSDIALTAGLSTSDGFFIDGPSLSAYIGRRGTLAGGHDVNGDGFDDILIGSDHYGGFTGAAWLIFGKAGGIANLDLAALSASDGVRFNGEAINNYTGDSVAFTGDLNGDGLSEILIGGERTTYSGRATAGKAYVIYGKQSGWTNLALGSLSAADGFIIGGANATDQVGEDVASAGDVNGDGIDDIVVGAPNFDPAAGGDAGTSYVIYGTGSNRSDLDMLTLSASDGFRVDGETANDDWGYSNLGVGDVNGDGRDDFLVGTQRAMPGGVFLAGSAYIIYGQNGNFSNLDINAGIPASAGFRIDGTQNTGFLNTTADAGDFNGDGLNDIIVGNYSYTATGGTVLVVYGKSNPNDIRMNTLSAADGFRIDPAVTTGQFGYSVAAVGDINGDGCADMAAGNHGETTSVGASAGRIYVVFGGR